MALRVYSVGKGSVLCKAQDPITGNHFEPGDQIVLCPRCDTPHLVTSWQYNGSRCSMFECDGHGSIGPVMGKQPNAVSAVLSHVSPVVMSADALGIPRQSFVHIIARLLQGVYVVGYPLVIILTVGTLAIVFLVDLCGGIPCFPEITIAVGLVIGCVIAMLVTLWFAMYFGYSLWCRVLRVEPIPAIDLVDSSKYGVLVVLGWIGVVGWMGTVVAGLFIFGESH